MLAADMLLEERRLTLLHQITEKISGEGAALRSDIGALAQVILLLTE